MEQTCVGRCIKKKKKKKRSPLVLNLSGPCGRASWWQMDWLSASAVCRLGALYSSLLGKTEPFFLPVDSCLLERLRKTSVACKGERQGKGEREGEKKIWQKHWQTALALNVPAHCLLCIVYSGRKHGDTSARLLHLALAARRLLRKQVPAVFVVSVRDTELIH